MQPLDDALVLLADRGEDLPVGVLIDRLESQLDIEGVAPHRGEHTSTMTTQRQPVRRSRYAGIGSWRGSLIAAGVAVVVLVVFAAFTVLGTGRAGDVVINPAPPTTTPEPVETTIAEPVVTTITAVPTTTIPPILGQGSGSGDAVEALSIIDEPGVVTFTHDGEDSFTVWDLGETGERIGVLVDTTGPYTGTRPLQWATATTGFEIVADGNWSYVILPGSEIRDEECPFVGEGDNVVHVRQYSSAPGPAHITFDGNTDFVIWTYGFMAPERIVNAIGPYEGTVPVGDLMVTWDITANGGSWTIDCG